MTLKTNLITKPMLSGKVDDVSHLNYPVEATPKLDGIRCLKVDGKVVSRTFKPIKNDFIRTHLEAILPDGADGEVMVGTTFQECTSGVMRQSGEPDFSFYMFDYVKDDIKKPYLERMLDMQEWYDQAGRPERVVLWLPITINDTDTLNSYEADCLNDGYEGVMVRSPKGPYKCGRGTLNEGYLLKVKRFDDAEAEVIGFEELLHNNNVATKDAFGRTERSSHKENKVPAGVLGKLILKHPDTGIEFGCGTGLTAKQRKEFWENKDSLVGKIVKYKFFSIGVKDAPRHPVFQGFRDKDDM